MRELIKLAEAFAIERHKGQKRKWTGRNYVEHPLSVAYILSQLVDTEFDGRLIVVALLHDVIEDTSTTEEEIEELFGNKIRNLVVELTTHETGMKKTDKKYYLTEVMDKMSEEALTVKLADRLHNVLGLTDEGIPKHFIDRYWEETKYIIDNLNHELNDIQRELVERITKTLVYIKLNKSM